MITVKSKGDFRKTYRFLNVARKLNPYTVLKKYGDMGLEALQEATPSDSGTTAMSWRYDITREGDMYYLTFENTNVNNGVNIAIILDVGHGTRNGGYVRGRNYIKPAVRPIFDQIADAAWKEVTDA